MLTNIKARLHSIFRGATPGRVRSQFVDVGFHGDRYLLLLVESLAADCTTFIETGTNVGSTLAYVARTYPGLHCLSCEPDAEAFDMANQMAGKYKNALLFRGTSQEFITFLTTEQSWVFSEKCFFWLDAHGYGFEWPLKEELQFITRRFKSGYVLIDDFKVPGREDFSYDTYQNQVCSFDYVKDSLNPERKYHLYYPAYSEKTSQHHPLCGWGLLSFGHDEFQIPAQLASKVERVQ